MIVDEAHNARTALSFQTLAGLAPWMVVELTATPQLQSDPEKGLHPSNVLFHISAADLKAEEMIKLPVRLNTDADWRKVIGQACDCQMALEEEAQREEAETGEYIRPIILFQAQSASKTDPYRLTPDRVKQHLVDDRGIPKDRIVIHSAGKSELDAVPASRRGAARCALSSPSSDCAKVGIARSLCALLGGGTELAGGGRTKAPGAEKMIDRLFIRSNRIQASESRGNGERNRADGLLS